MCLSKHALNTAQLVSLMACSCWRICSINRQHKHPNCTRRCRPLFPSPAAGAEAQLNMPPAAEEAAGAPKMLPAALLAPKPPKVPSPAAWLEAGVGEVREKGLDPPPKPPGEAPKKGLRWRQG